MEDAFGLRSFVVSILRKWKMILILTVLFGILLGAVKFIKGQGEIKDGYTIGNTDYNERIKTLKKEIKKLEKDIRIGENYYLNSRLSEVDIYSGKVYFVDFLVEPNSDSTAETLKRNDIAAAYANYINKGSVYEELEGMNGLQENMQELIRAKAEGGLVTVEAYLVRDLDVQKIVELMWEYLQNNQPISSGEDSSYSIQKVSSGRGIVSDFSGSSFAQNQENALVKVDRYQNALDNRKKRLEILKSEGGYQEVTAQTVFFDTIKYGIVGCIGGFAIGIILGLFLDLMSDKICEGKELETMGLPYILNLQSVSGNKKHNLIDRKIDRLVGISDKKISDMEKADCIFTSIMNELVNRVDFRKIMIVSTAWESDMLEIVKETSRKGKQENIDIGYKACISLNADIIKTISESDGIIFLERAGVSKASDISVVRDTIIGMKKEILGFVMV